MAYSCIGAAVFEQIWFDPGMSYNAIFLHFNYSQGEETGKEKQFGSNFDWKVPFAFTEPFFFSGGNDFKLKMMKIYDNLKSEMIKSPWWLLR